MTELKDEQIIQIRQAPRRTDPTKPWDDTIKFARAVIDADRAARSTEVPTTQRVELDPAGAPKLPLTQMEFFALTLINNLKAMSDGDLIKLPATTCIEIDVFMTAMAQRRIGVR